MSSNKSRQCLFVIDPAFSIHDYLQYINFAMRALFRKIDSDRTLQLFVQENQHHHNRCSNVATVEQQRK